MTSAPYPAEEPNRALRGGGLERRRWIAAALAIALHLAILALFLHGHPAPTTGEGFGQGAMDVSLAGLSKGSAPSRARATPAPAAPPAKPAAADPIKPRSVLRIVSDILAIPVPDESVTPQPLLAAPTPTLAQAAAPASGSPGAACDIGGAVQNALRSDPDTHDAVLLIARQQKSLANAMLLWNGQWIDPAGVGGPTALTTVRTSVRQIAAAARPDCREQEIVGPRFMLIPDGDGTVVVVVGNASWRWSDMLVDPLPPARDSMGNPG